MAAERFVRGPVHREERLPYSGKFLQGNLVMRGRKCYC